MYNGSVMYTKTKVYGLQAGRLPIHMEERM